MTEDEVCELTMSHFAALMRPLGSTEERIQATMVMLHLAYQVQRCVLGDEWMIRWLRDALDDLEGASQAAAPAVRDLQ
jgi:CRISPR/Cas system CSM-associated protein Csm2 small subunit